jgi:pSer/pThr/pTyr-binding forkhead associated (FHA) protein
MHVKLKVLRGSPKVTRGPKAVRDRIGDMKRYLVGSGDDCHLMHPSNSLSPQHCVIVIHGHAVAVQDMGSQTGTFVNGQRVDQPCYLQIGDELQMGPLRFRVIIESDEAAMQGEVAEEAAPQSPPPPAPDAPAPPAKTTSDDGGISDWLIDADEAERVHRLAHPEARKLKLETPQLLDAEQLEKEKQAAQHEAEAAAMQAKQAKKPPEKQPPGKLPPRSLDTSRDSIDAADQMLKRMFGVYYRPPTK